MLYFDGCPSHEALLPRLRELMEEAAIDAPVSLIHVVSAEGAERTRFLGSPTLRIDGRDVDPSADHRGDYGLKCRLYAHADGVRRAVPDELIRAALRARGGHADRVAATQPPEVAQVLRDAFPAADDAPLALTLLRLLAEGQPVELSSLARAAGRDQDAVHAQVEEWPNVERDDDGAVVGFSGLTLRATDHHFDVGGQALHTWCAWDTLFLPALLGMTANVRSTCPVSGATAELVVTPSAVVKSKPEDVQVSFPTLATTDASHITNSFCCHVRFIVGAEAAASWEADNAGGQTFDLAEAFALGQQAVAPVLSSPRRSEAVGHA